MTSQPRGDGRRRVDQRATHAWTSGVGGPTRGSIWAPGSGRSFLAAKERRTTQLSAHSQGPDEQLTCSSGKAELSLALGSEGDFSRAVLNTEPFIKSFLQLLGLQRASTGLALLTSEVPGGPHPLYH